MRMYIHNEYNYVRPLTFFNLFLYRTVLVPVPGTVSKEKNERTYVRTYLPATKN